MGACVNHPERVALMPIKDKSRYPPDWKAVSLRIRERAGQKCEDCGMPNKEMGVVVSGGFWALLDSPAWHDRHGSIVFVEVFGKPLPSWLDLDKQRAIRSVLTVAHLDHDPGNNADDNLRAKCAGCHLRYDAEHHKANAMRTRRAKAGQLEFA